MKNTEKKETSKEPTASNEKKNSNDFNFIIANNPRVNDIHETIDRIEPMGIEDIEKEIVIRKKEINEKEIVSLKDISDHVNSLDKNEEENTEILKSDEKEQISEINQNEITDEIADETIKEENCEENIENQEITDDFDTEEEFNTEEIEMVEDKIEKNPIDYKKMGKTILIVVCTALLVLLIGLTINTRVNKIRNELRSQVAVIVDEKLYTPITYQNYQNTINKGIKVANSIFSTNNDVLKALDNIKIAYDSLELVPDKSKLNELLKEALALDLSSFTPNSIEEYNKEIEKIKAIFNDENANEQAVVQAEENISKAKELLVAIADKSKLTEVITKAEGISVERYIPLSQENLKSVLTAAKVVMEDENASQEVVNGAVERINNALDEMEPIPNKKPLETLINNKSNYSENKYTAGSWNRLELLIEQAQAVVDDVNATQTTVNGMVDSLNEAYKSLEKAKGVFEVTITITKLDNNDIGNNWSSEIYFNDKLMDSGENKFSYVITDTIECDSSVVIRTKMIENDDNPDYGEKSATVVFTDGSTSKYNITVSENEGFFGFFKFTRFEVNISVKQI